MSSVATVMPEIGFEDEPISPVMRLETVTKKKPKSSDQQRRRESESEARRERDREQQRERAAEHERDREIALGAQAARRRPRARSCCAAPRNAADDGRQRAHEREKPAGRDGAGADVEEVGVADLAGRHLAHRQRAAADQRRGELRPKSVIAGISTQNESTPPPIMTSAMRVPMM